MRRLRIGGFIENSDYEDLIKEHFRIAPWKLNYSFFRITDHEFIIWTGIQRDLIYLLNQLIEHNLISTDAKWKLVHNHFRYYGRKDKSLRKFIPTSLSSTATREKEKLNRTYCSKIYKIVDTVKDLKK